MGKPRCRLFFDKPSTPLACAVSETLHHTLYRQARAQQGILLYGSQGAKTLKVLQVRWPACMPCRRAVRARQRAAGIALLPPRAPNVQVLQTPRCQPEFARTGN